ncbi:MAG: trans-sulfuration enzyme family protein [Planctomycetota bacterium]
MKRGLHTTAVHSAPSFSSPSVPIAPHLTLASVYRFADLETLTAASRGEAAPWAFYRRYGHANGRQLEETVAALEGAQEAVACASGMSAALALFSVIAGKGDRILASRDLYGGTRAFLAREPARRGVEVEFRPLEEIERGVPAGTRAVVVETISNPLVRVADLARVARHARRAGALLVVDNTFATPFLCRPLDWGADVVWHSGTKLLNGHGDAVSGVVCGPAGLIGLVRKFAVSVGATVSPLDAWLTLRGLKTLGVRVARASENAARMAAFLARHPKVVRVHYPRPGRYLRRLRGTILSFELRGGLRAASKFLRACRLIALAPSLGDVTTTSSHPARTSHAYLSEEERAAMGVTDGLVRLSAGLEDPEDLLEDLSGALSKI